MRLYEAGPMRDIPLLNHPAFDKGAADLRRAGYEVFSPAEHDRDLGIDPTQGELDNAGLRKVLGDDLAWITANAEGIALLPGWLNSKGACAEVATALAIGIPVMPVREWVELKLKVDPVSYVDFWTDYCGSALFGKLPVGMAVPS